jgi:hypothetical protein
VNWVQLGGSLAAVLALSGAAWWMRLGRDARIASVEEAAEAIDGSLPGFVTGGAVMGADGRAALAVDRRGERVAVCKRHGAKLAVREVGWAALRSTPGGIVVETGEKRFGQVPIAGVDALDVRRLAPNLQTGPGLAHQLTRV